MATTNLEAIITALLTAVEAIVPDFRPDVRFKRWRGEGKVEDVKGPLRERAIQFRMGRSKTPRTLSSPTKQWNRAELIFVVGYNFSEPRQNDTTGFGMHQQVFSDERQLRNKIFFANSLAGVPDVLRFAYDGADEPGKTARIFRFDIEWAETFS